MCLTLKVRAYIGSPHNCFLFLLDKTGQDVVQFKVGRTVAMNRRLAEHNNKCGSSHPILINFYPTPDETNEPTPGASDESTGEPATDVHHSQPNLTLSMIRPGEKLLYSHMLECLVHLELSDIAANSHPALGIVPGGRTGAHIPRRPCVDCE